MVGCAMVGPLGCQRVVAVGNGDEARKDGNCFARESSGIAVAVEAFMMTKYGLSHHCKSLVRKRHQNVEAALRVSPHDGQFVGIQATLLQQYVVRNSELADVMKLRGQSQRRE